MFPTCFPAFPGISYVFPVISHLPHVFARSLDGFIELSVFFVISQSDNFGFGLTTVYWIPRYPTD